MGTDRRVGAFERQVARLTRARAPDAWTIDCRDRDGHRCLLLVDVTATGLSLDASAPGPWHIEPLNVGALRGVLRDAIVHLDRTADSP
ncbi:hypothetical protein SAMN06265360_106254 [Haloechinothrix alba]|uniref:Uncharacterized protein n=1 Tax=Haloechinothrix alba TaxID=664784 RepID=A0A238WK54_9PSEU|nr:hypothetical protein SAMN06265360_106254 [Haloechinothrix alba]